MRSLVPYGADAATESHVGFTIRGKDYTPEHPCMFDNYCTPKDWDNWKRHSMQWILAIKPNHEALHHTLMARYAELTARNDSCMISCTPGTQAMISIARLAHLAAKDSGNPVTDIEHEWGWPIAPLPIAADVLAELRELFEKAKKKIQAHVWERWSLYLLGGGFVLWFLYGRKEQRR